MQWIKATDRMPEDWDSVSAIRDTKNGGVISTDFIYKVHTETLNGIELDNSMWRGKGFIEMEDVEWLDETEWYDPKDAPKETLVLVYTDWDLIRVASLDEVGYSNGKTGYGWYDADHNENLGLGYVIGWQPLPKPMKV